MNTRETAMQDDVVPSVLRDVESGLEDVEAMYFDLHAHPELSGQEARTSAIVAAALRDAGFEVLTHVGGHGVVGSMKNGPGPVVAVRGDMDALPVEEQTGLAYASVTRGVDAAGRDVPVMHACGHDVHVACLVGMARLLARHREAWSGTLLVIAQPAEETVSGARAMLGDGVYARTATPDVLLGQHVVPALAGMLVHRAGALMAGTCSLRVEVFGKGGHGSQPQMTIDPIVIASAAVGRLQTIVARELGPYVSAVVTVGSFHAGARSNIIPERAVLEISVRTFEPETTERVLASIHRILKGECAAAAAPREPSISILERVGPLVTDAAAVERVKHVQGAILGNVVDAPFPVTGSEDFGELAKRDDGASIPTAFWLLGGVGESRWNALEGSLMARMQATPANHSPFYHPDPEPTLRRGIEALACGALAYLASRPIAA